MDSANEKIHRAVRELNKIHDIGYPVLVLDMKEEPDDSINELIIDSAGFTAVKLETDEQIEQIANVLGLTDAEFQHFAYDPQVILVGQQIAMKLSPEKIKAIFLHETGHLKLKHTETRGLAKMNTDISKEVILQQEIEADKYAASILGKKIMRKALISGIFLACRYKYKGIFAAFKAFYKTMQDPEIKMRLSLLK